SRACIVGKPTTQVQLKTNPLTKLPFNPGLSPNDWYGGWGQVTQSLTNSALADPVNSLCLNTTRTFSPSSPASTEF
ncbi:hypothetical protein, partial [Inhella sp.]|uniref:hypothetical protein n=1 Tax=Inhella sp. TaxID=1921806 RepID=UPI0035B4E463